MYRLSDAQVEVVRETQVALTGLVQRLEVRGINFPTLRRVRDKLNLKSARCIECETEFQHIAYQQKFCSNRCRNTHLKRKHRQRHASCTGKTA